MPNYFENYGLEFLTENDDTLYGFVSCLIQDGKAINGYYGCPTIFKCLGSIDFYVKTQKNDDGKLEVLGLDVHCGNLNVWKLINTGMDLTPADALSSEKLLVLKSAETGSGMLPVHILNADILPSFLENDVYNVQMSAIPIDMKYYVDEDEYANEQPELDNGKKWLLASGSLIPTGLLNNHVPGDRTEKDYSTDDCVLFAGIVKAMHWGIFEINGQKHNTFVRCIIDTQFGELELDHTFEQIPEKYRDNIKVGSYVSGVCVLSGDVAIDEYENGLIKDYEHDLLLTRFAMERGEAERLRPVLTDSSLFTSDNSDKQYHGADEIIEHINYVQEKVQNLHTEFATITKSEDDLKYSVNTRCIVIAYKEDEPYSDMVFIDVDSEGIIERISISTESRYQFNVDEPSCINNILDNVEMPATPVESIILRAKFHGLIDNDVELSDIVLSPNNKEELEQKAKVLLNALKENTQSNIEVALENVFGYLFAKAIEETEIERDSKCIDYAVSISPSDAFAGRIATQLPGEKCNSLMKAMKLGTQFFKDFKIHTMNVEPDDAAFTNSIIESLVVVQEIGKLYSSKCFK